MKDYFVIVFKEGRTLEVVEVLYIKRFYEIGELFKWMQDNRQELYSVYEAECVLDYS